MATSCPVNNVDKHLPPIFGYNRPLQREMRISAGRFKEEVPDPKTTQLLFDLVETVRLFTTVDHRKLGSPQLAAIASSSRARYDKLTKRVSRLTW